MTETNEMLSNLDIKYHFLIDNILDVVGELDLNGIFTYVNPYIYDELGYQPNEIIGREIYEFVHPDDAKKITKVLLRRPKSLDFIPEIRLKNDKNQFIWYEIKARRIIDYINQRKILITLKNISKVKVLEEKLEKKEENYQKITNSIPEIQFWKVLTHSKYERAVRTTSEMLKVIVENIPQCVFWKDTNFKYMGCNGNYSEFIGIEHPESIIGKTDEDLLLNREKIQQIRESETNVMLSGKPLYHTNESWIIEKGENIWLDINRVPLIDTKGDVNGILVTFEEITDRKIAEEKIHNSEKKYKNLSIELETIIDIIPSMIFVKNKSGIYTRVNQIFADYLKLEKEDIIGRSTFDLFPQELATKLKRDDLEVIKNGIPKLNIEETAEFPVGKVSGIISKMPYYNEKDEINGVIGFAIDISERKELEQRLIKSEERYRNLFSNSPNMIALLDLSGKLLDVNESVIKFTGDTKNNIIGKSFQDFEKMFVGNLSILINKFKEMLKNRSIESFEIQLHDKNNRKIWVNLQAFLIEIKNEMFIQVIMEDITDRKKAEEKLKESEEKYKSLFEKTPMAILLIDFEGIIKDCNISTEVLFGYTKEEVLGFAYLKFDIFSPDTKLILAKSFSKFLKTGVPEHSEIQMYRKDGKMIWINSYPINVKIAEKSYILAVIQDITERKVAEQNIKESEEKYRILVETAVMGLIEFDVEGNNVSYINPKLLEILGYTKKDLLVEKIFLKIVHPEDLKELIESSEDRYVKFRIFTKDGKLKWLSGTRNNRFNQEGKLISGRLWLQDITESKEIEEIKSSLLTRFSHEFKTPLISIKGFADFLLTEYKVNLDEKILSFLRRIKEGSNRLEVLINSFTISSQLEKTLIQVNLRQEDISDLIQKVLHELEGFIGMREHTINVSLDEKLITSIDKEKIYTVISDILINAIDYTPPGGKISIKSSIDKKFLTISVEDNGIGLTEEEKKCLFKPFGKIERYGRGWDITVGGMGMGLYISKEMIELHGGKIWVESEGRNKGSTFYFSIPITK